MARFRFTADGVYLPDLDDNPWVIHDNRKVFQANFVDLSDMSVEYSYKEACSCCWGESRVSFEETYSTEEEAIKALKEMKNGS